MKLVLILAFNPMSINQFVQGYRFKVSGYSGFEETILRMRNLNRDNPKTRQYFNWRYENSDASYEPKVFWLMSASGEAIGMASLIFRLYWVNNQPCRLAVLGDISLDASCRGKGLGRKLLQFVSQYIGEHLPDHFGLVIPTETARKSLASIGWITEGMLIPYVFLLDPKDKFTRLLRSKWLAKCASRVFHDMVFRLVRKYSKIGYSIQIVREPDESFELFWKGFLKDNFIISDKGIKTLLWRYVDHPQHQFFFAKLMRGDWLTGYLIYEYSKENQACSIYDVIVRRDQTFGRTAPARRHRACDSEKPGHPDS